MARKILLNTFGSLGDLNPYLGLAIGLKKRGYDPVIATAGIYRDYVEREGVGFHPVRPDASPEDRDLIIRIMHRRRGMEYLFREVMFGNLRETYRDLEEAARGASLMVTHPLSFAGQVLAEKNGIPRVSTVLSPISFLSASDPPVFPMYSFLRRLRPLGPFVNRWAVIRLSKLYTRNWCEPVFRLREELGLPPGKNPMHEGQHSPILVLALFSRVMAAPQPDWPPNTTVTGFVHYDVDPGGGGTQETFRRFLDEGPLPIVFTLGSSAVFAAGDFYREIVKAARSLGRRAALLVGRDLPDNVPDSLPDGVAAFPYAPHSLIFPRSAALVHSGGIGTIGQALGAGKPSLIVSFGFDQPDNAARVAKLGVGRAVSAYRYNAGIAARHLGKILEDPVYSKNASAVGEQVRSEDGVGTACDAIEKIVAPE